MLRKFSLITLVLVISCVYFYTAGGRAILDDGDALYSHVAQQMIERGDWVTPYANGVRFLDKPPLMYWLMATSFKTFGMTEFAARTPSVLAVVGIGLLLYLIGARVAGQPSGFIAGMASAFCVGTFLFTRMVFPDILLVFLLTLAIYGFLHWYTDDDFQSAMLFYLSLAGAVLTKGIIGALFPLAIVAVFLLFSRDWKRLKDFHIGTGTLLFLAVALPWHVLAARRNPGFLWYYFVNEHVLRFLGRRQPVDYESISVPVFWALILLWMFPWSAFLPAVRHLLHRGSMRNRSLGAVIWLSVSWIAVVLGFFSISSRIEHYSMPIFPPLALLAGIALSPDDLRDLPSEFKRRRWVDRGFGILGIVGGLLALVLLAAGVAWLSGLGRAEIVRSITDPRSHAYKYYFAPIFELPRQVLLRLKTPLIGTALAFSIGMMGAWWTNRRGDRTRAVMLLSGMMVVFFLFAFQSLGVCEGMLSSKRFGRLLTSVYRPGDALVRIGDYETANSINFYSPIPLEVYKGTAAVLEWGSRYPDAPRVVLTGADFETRWSGPSRTFALVNDDEVDSLHLAPSFLVMRSYGRTLLCNESVPIN